MRDGSASESLCVASFNARRLWQHDQSVHEGFRVFSDSLLENHVGVVCIQEVFAGDFPTLPSDQPYTYDGPIGSGGREAAFLVRAGVCGSPVLGVADSTSVRWRVFNNAWCICSYYAPHAGLPQETRVSFWRDFVAVAQRVQNAVSVPMIIARDANVWHPHFNLSRSRSCDVPIIPFLDLLMVSCRLELCNPPDWIASSSLQVMLWMLWCTMGCNVAQVPLCVAQCWGQTISCASQLVCLFPLVRNQCVDQLCRRLRDWRPTLIRAHAELLQWSARVHDLCQSSPPRRHLLDGVFQ